MDRRSFLTGLIGVVAAPAIVRASSLMPVKSWVDAIAYPEATPSLIETIRLIAEGEDQFGDVVVETIDLPEESFRRGIIVFPKSLKLVRRIYGLPHSVGLTFILEQAKLRLAGGDHGPS